MMMSSTAWSKAAVLGLTVAAVHQPPPPRAALPFVFHAVPAAPAPASVPAPAARPGPEVRIFVGPTQLPVLEEQPVRLNPPRVEPAAERILDETEGRVAVVSDEDEDLVAKRDSWIRAQGADFRGHGTYYPNAIDNPENPAQLKTTTQYLASQTFGGYAPPASARTAGRQSMRVGPARLPSVFGSPRIPVRASVALAAAAKAAAVYAQSGAQPVGQVKFNSNGTVTIVTPQTRAAPTYIPGPAAAPTTASAAQPLGVVAVLKSATGAIVETIKRIAYDPTAQYGSRYTYDITYGDGKETIYKASPLIFDLDGAGLRTSQRRVAFDIAAEGRAVDVADIGPGVGVLCFGACDSGLKLFGDRTDLDGDGRPDGYADGFAALESFVRDAVRAGVIDGDALSRRLLTSDDLGRLEKAYGLGMLVGGLRGHVLPLRRAGVLALRLSGGSAHLQKDFDGRGDDLSSRRGAFFTRRDGSRGGYADVWLAYRSTSKTVPSYATVTGAPSAKYSPKAGWRPIASK